MQGEADDKKSTSGDDSIIRHVAVENDTDEETFPHPKFSRTAPKFSRIAPPTSAVKNTTENGMSDTGQYYDTHDIFMVKDERGEVIMMLPSLDLNRTV